MDKDLPDAPPASLLVSQLVSLGTRRQQSSVVMDVGFPIFSAPSMRRIAMRSGDVPKETIDGIEDEVLLRLSEDVTYRISEVIRQATQFSRHSSRRNLKVSDINNALETMDVSRSYGYSEGISFPSGGQGEKEVDLIKEAARIISSRNTLDIKPVQPALSTTWLKPPPIPPNDGNGPL